MRSLLLVILALVIVAGGFFAYWKMQPPTPMAKKGPNNGVVVKQLNPDDPSYVKLRGGEEPWINEYDDAGYLSRKFRAERYTPQKNGTILVTKPDVWFFSGGKPQLELIGEDGEIVMSTAPDLTPPSTAIRDNAPAAPPNRGRLNHVTVRMFSAESGPTEPDEVLTANNIEFNNETLLITTESFIDAAGNTVAADQVPVHLVGKYDFDGRGLTMRWNDRDGRLEMLVIEHGEQLIIKDTSGFSGLTGTPTGSTKNKSTALNNEPVLFRSTSVTSALTHISLPLSEMLREHFNSAVVPIMLAARDNTGVGQAVRAGNAKPTTKPARRPAKPKATTPVGPTPYLATFNDNVTITRGDLIAATADRMTVDFLTKQDSEKPTTAPATSPSPSTAPSQLLSANPVAPLTQSTEDAPLASTTMPATSPAQTQPTTKSTAPPVVIRWTGKLTIVPATPERHAALTAGSAIITLTGKPVTIVQKIPEQKKWQDIRAATAVFHTGDRSMSLDNSADVSEVVLKESSEGKTDPTRTLTTDAIDYVSSGHLANFRGAGHLVAPADENAPDKGNLAVSWTQGAKAYLLGGATGEGDMTLEHMDLTGDVDVRHPSLSMQSQNLSLFFDPGEHAATQPTARKARAAPREGDSLTTRPAREEHQQLLLSRVFASTAVHCKLIDEGKFQTIESDQLELLTTRSTDGQFHPRVVLAKGTVHAFDAEQDLRTRWLEITLKSADTSTDTTSGKKKKPATQPADGQKVDLERMHAMGDVVASSVKGWTASGDDLEVTLVDREPHVRITSELGNARIVDEKHNIITGPIITAQPKLQLAHIEGLGSVQAMMDDQGKSKPRPVDVSWNDRADLNGTQNTIDAIGKTVLHMVDTDGTVIESTADTVHIDLEDKPVPATQPAKPARAQAAVARPAVAATNPATRAAGPTSRASKTASTDPLAGDSMDKKQVQAVTLDGNASVTSTLLDEAGKIVLRKKLEGEKLIYRSVGTPQQQAHSVLLPGPGRILVSDHQPADKRGADTGSGIGGGRGDTAFQWSRQFLYDEVANRATMSGNVVVAFLENQKVEPVRVNAAIVTAEFEPTAKATALTNASPTTRPASKQLKFVSADGDATGDAYVTRNGSQLLAHQITFDPHTHWITAKGTKAQPARFVPADGGGTTTAEILQWNSVTWQIKVSDATLQTAPRQGSTPVPPNSSKKQK